jgi:hypothetical protein
MSTTALIFDQYLMKEIHQMSEKVEGRGLFSKTDASRVSIASVIDQQARQGIPDEVGIIKQTIKGVKDSILH